MKESRGGFMGGRKKSKSSGENLLQKKEIKISNEKS